MDLYGISRDDKLVAAFAPFALYGPAMGITSVVPDMDVTAPATLTAAALADAVAAVDATVVFGSPAALQNVVNTRAADAPTLDGVRVVLSAGAPVSANLLRAATSTFPNASMHTPYGMTEVLPVSSISLEELDQAAQAAGGLSGVCVGTPLPTCLLYTSPSPRDATLSRMPSSA